MGDDPFIRHLRGTQERTQRLLHNAEQRSVAKYGWGPPGTYQAAPSVMAFDARWITRMGAARAPLRTLVPPALQQHHQGVISGGYHSHSLSHAPELLQGQSPAIQPSPARHGMQPPTHHPNPPPAWYRPGTYPIPNAVNTIDHLGVILDATTPVPPEWVAKCVPHIQNQILPIAQLPTLTSLQYQLGVLQGSFQGAMEILGCLSSLSSLAGLAHLSGQPLHPGHQPGSHTPPSLQPDGHHHHPAQAQLPQWWGTSGASQPPGLKPQQDGRWQPPEEQAEVYPAQTAPQHPNPHESGSQLHLPHSEASFSHPATDNPSLPSPHKPYRPPAWHQQYYPSVALPHPTHTDTGAGDGGSALIDALIRKNNDPSHGQPDVDLMLGVPPPHAQQQPHTVPGSTFLTAQQPEPDLLPPLPALRPVQEPLFDDSAGRQAGAMPPAGMGRLIPPQRSDQPPSPQASLPPPRRPRRPLESFDDSARRMGGRAPPPEQEGLIVEQGPGDSGGQPVDQNAAIQGSVGSHHVTHSVQNAPAASEGMHAGARMWMDLGGSQGGPADTHGFRVSGISVTATSVSSIESALGSSVVLGQHNSVPGNGITNQETGHHLRQSDDMNGPPTPTVLVPFSPPVPRLVPDPIQVVSAELLRARRTYAEAVQVDTRNAESRDQLHTSQIHSLQDHPLPTASSSPAHSISSPAASTPRLSSTSLAAPQFDASPTRPGSKPLPSLDMSASRYSSVDPTQPRITFSPDAKAPGRAGPGVQATDKSFASASGSVPPLGSTWDSKSSQAFSTMADDVLMGTVDAATAFPAVTEEDAVLMGTVDADSAFPVVTDEDAVLMGTVDAETAFPVLGDDALTMHANPRSSVVPDDEAVLIGTLDSTVGKSFPTLDADMILPAAAAVPPISISPQNEGTAEMTISRQLVSSASSSTVMFGSLPTNLDEEQQQAFSAAGVL